MQFVDTDTELLRRLDPTDSFMAMVATFGAEIIPVGPFRALFSNSPNNISFSEAHPVDPLPGSAETLEALHELRRLFVDRDATANVQLNVPIWKDLVPLLEEAGYALDEREPLMIVPPGDFRPFFNPAVDVHFLQVDDPDADLAGYRSIFGEILLEKPWTATPEGIANFRSEVEQANNHCHALAKLDGTPVGTGFISSFEGLAEIARVATLPVARRKGVAATVTSFMLEDRFKSGDTLAWLSAQTDMARALYIKLGFRLVGERLYYSAA